MSETQTPEVFAISGVEPEVLAYAMAKYSRSALSMRDSIKTISTQKASEFLNTFYFAYGHRSIADLAHIPMAVENVSLLAAIEVVDEQRWDGQERSTRYQDFSKRKHHVPENLPDVMRLHYDSTITMLFDAYDEVYRQTVELFRNKFPTPIGMNEEDAERTRKARAFDVARYLLPMATTTSVGQITSARTLEGQISRMKASRYPEVQLLAAQMQVAASANDSFNPNAEIPSDENAQLPTLLKHCEPDEFGPKLRKFAQGEITKLKADPLSGLAAFDGGWQHVEPEPVRPFLNLPIEEEIITTILYEHSHYPFDLLYKEVRGWDRVRRENFLTQAQALRGKFDELPRAFRSQGGIIFDIVLDIGAMRDLHRHRRCTQVFQEYEARTFAVPEEITFNATLHDYVVRVLTRLQAAYEIMQKLCVLHGYPEAIADYLLPLCTRRRFLMKMDVGQLDYIAELRTRPQGHIAYRRIAWEMFKTLQIVAPGLTKGLEDRVTDPDSPLDFFKR